MKYVFALLVSLSMLSPANASKAYDALDKRLETLSKQSNDAMDKLQEAMVLDQACKDGLRSAEVCAKAKVTCQNYVDAFNEADSAFQKMHAEIEAAQGITTAERDYLLRLHGLISVFKNMVKSEITKTACTDV